MYNPLITKENLDQYLKELAREFRKRNGKTIPAEIILIGGASILVNYGFREMTYDMDAIIRASSVMKEAINHVSDVFGLPNGWLNADFTRTKSYSPKLIACSRYYKTFLNVLSVRTVTSEYLIAMKLMSGRKYKNDLSDIIGILWEHQKNNNPISMEQIDDAICYLYDNWGEVPQDSIEFIHSVMDVGDLETLYGQYREGENLSQTALLDIEVKYPGIINEGNIDKILKDLKNRK